MEKEELKQYVEGEIHRLNRMYKSQPMPQRAVGARYELEFILDLLEGSESAIMIAKAVIETDNEVKVYKEESNDGSK